MSQSTIAVEHVRLTVEKPFAEFTTAFEKQLGAFDASAYEALETGGDPESTRARLESMTGTSGFMLFRTSNHGRLLRLVGEPKNAMQYLLGNPLLAVEMTRYALGAALYAPLRVLVYETEPGKTCVEYDLPSSQFGQFADERVDRMAESLDRKLFLLVESASR